MTIRSLVTGAGGFIGGHLVRALVNRGHEVRAVDIKPITQWWQVHQTGVENLACRDLRLADACYWACEDIDWVFNLAASMGGIGFIETNKAGCAMNVLIGAHMLQAARVQHVSRFFFSSSACVYAADKQNRPLCTLVEEDAYPAMPEDGYGWEKLYTERLCRHFMEDYGLECRVARFHNVYGPHGEWEGGREKAPAAICRKIAVAKRTRDLRIDIWGDGTQTRSFMWIDDCITGILRIMESGIREPINLGSSRDVSINTLVSLVEEFAGISCSRMYQLNKPKGVAGRNSDNTKIKALLGWEPSTPLTDGLAKTYAWIEGRVFEQLECL